MKPAAFEYSRPETVDEAVALLAADDGARLIAGGQTLVPLMAMRLARPSRLVDIARLSELATIRERGDEIIIGATTKQCAVEGDATIRTRLPMLARAITLVGHTPTRARGTVGGSIVNADPAAEIVLVAVTLGASVTWREGGRDTHAHISEFVIGPMVTSLPQAACLTSVRFPVWNEPKTGVGFHEVNARSSDFAFASAAAQVALDGDGRCARVALGIGAVTAYPVRIDADALIGTRAEEKRVFDVVDAALSGVEAMDDLHATAAYRKRAARTLAARAVAEAYKNAHRADHARRA
jgi:CO/xanthine dehydrogenase FAD-binding subunit